MLDVLDLAAGEEPDSFVGESLPSLWGRVFGGQVLAQGLIAAGRTVDGDRAVHSMHAYFLRPGDPAKPITFAVERLRDGRSFSARRTHALQDGVPILSMISSFQVPSAGLEHQTPMPEVPAPEDLPSPEEWTAGMTHPARATQVGRPVDIRHVDGPLLLDAGPQRTAKQAVWLRSAAPLPHEPALHAAVLAFASDYTMLEPLLRRHRVAWVDPRLKVASLDHAMWWHRPARADEWLLYVQDSPSAQGARGLGTALLYRRDGALVATVAQEGMIRL
ncbi:MAG: acyl-CoA thioesterase II [Kineosporiaceae bacterium]